MAYFFGIDGLNGAGKTTVIKLVAAGLLRRGLSCDIVRFPGETEPGKQIRETLLHSQTEIEAITQFLLFATDNALTWIQHLSKYKDVSHPDHENLVFLCDRTHLSALAFQGAQGVDMDLMLQVYAAQGCQYDRVFVLDVPLTLAMKRLSDRGETLDRIESLDILIQAKIYTLWQMMQTIPHGQPVSYINATVPAAIVASQILTAIDRIMQK